MKHIIKLYNNNSFNELPSLIIPSVDSEQIVPKIKIYEANGIDFWYREIGFSKLTESNRKY